MSPEKKSNCIRKFNPFIICDGFLSETITYRAACFCGTTKFWLTVTTPVCVAAVWWLTESVLLAFGRVEEITGESITVNWPSTKSSVSFSGIEKREFT